jgi:hypothetical protein
VPVSARPGLLQILADDLRQAAEERDQCHAVSSFCSPLLRSLDLYEVATAMFAIASTLGM